MGAVRPDRDRGEGLKAGGVVTPSAPDAGGGVRVGEEGPPQQYGGQDDESDGYCIVHAFHKAGGVPKLQSNKINMLEFCC